MSRGAGSLLDEHIDPDYQPSEKEAGARFVLETTCKNRIVGGPAI